MLQLIIFHKQYSVRFSRTTTGNSLKFRFFERATKIAAIFLSVFNFGENFGFALKP
jgi:hypothetical protein